MERIDFTNRKAVMTADHSYTLSVYGGKEHYHSINGALTETQHVYIGNGLTTIGLNSISILEVGFGTGLNAITSYIYAEKKEKKIQYTGVEPYPLSLAELNELNYMGIPELSGYSDVFMAMHNAKDGEIAHISDTFSLKKIHSQIENFKLGECEYDLVYFDAFSPDIQPEVWSEPVFRSIFRSLRNHGVLTTYCAKGAVRRSLISEGFEVQRLPGPPGKREVIRATKTIL